LISLRISFIFDLFLTPIDRNLNLCQSDNLHLSYVYQQWKRLPNEFNALRLPDEHKNFIISKVNYRWLIGGVKPDLSLDLRARFGEIAIFKDPDPKDDTSPRGELGIILGRDFWSQGIHPVEGKSFYKE
jgi:hypothetical protein